MGLELLEGRLPPGDLGLTGALLLSDWVPELAPADRRAALSPGKGLTDGSTTSGQPDLLNTLGALPVVFNPAVTAPTAVANMPAPKTGTDLTSFLQIAGGFQESGPGTDEVSNLFVGPNVRANNRITCPGGQTGRSQSEVSMVWDPFSGAVVVGYNDSRGFNCSGQAPGYQVLGWASSFDGGFSFEDGGPLPGRTQLSGDPWLAVGPNGTIYFATLFNGLSNLAVLRGTPADGAIQWSNPTVISGDGSYDKEAMAVDPVTGNVYITYTRFGGPGGIWSLRSTDGGQSFERAVPVRSGAAPQLQGSFSAVGAYGEVLVAYNIGYPQNTGVGFAASYDEGQTYYDFGQVATITNFTIPGHNRGLHTDFPQLAVDTTGGPFTNYMYIVYSSQQPGTNGDVLMIRSTDGGFTWDAPRKVNDDATTGLQFFPTISVDSNGYVNVAFYDRRENPGSTITNLYFAQSRDGGESFGENVKITEVPSNWNCCTDLTPNYGDYIHSISAGPYTGVTWADGRDGDPDAYMAWIAPLD